ncbi:MAG: helix-turn-helix domain-containing protein [Candidatus Geothermincolia bacterium]
MRVSVKPRYNEFGKCLFSLRQSRGIGTQAELARLLGFKQQTVSRWEEGSSRPRADEIPAIAAALNADLAQLLLIAGHAPEGVTVSFDRPLPLHALTWDSFQRFSLHFLAALYPGDRVHPMGKEGHKQFGIDIEVTFADGRSHTFQCKREKYFGAAKVRTAIADQTAEATKKFILLSRVASPLARAEVRKHDDWDIWDQEDISRQFRSLAPVEQRRIVDIFFTGQRFALLGESEPGPWLTVSDFFAPQLAEGRIFNHRWNLVGRTKELDALACALADQSVVVVSLVGPVGGGKSRVLRSALEAFAATRPVLLLRVVSPTEEVTAKSMEDLGQGDKLLVVDDAHDRSDLGQLVRYAADERMHARLLLVYRPYWSDVVERELGQCGLTGGLVQAIPLEKPTKADALALASQVLSAHGAPLQSAAAIADMAYDSPLAVVVGAQIVAKERVHPESFGSNAEFRAIVLRRYEKVIAEDIAVGKDQVRVHSMLRIFALIQPFLPDDPRVLELLSSIEGIDASDASRIARTLIESGVLFKRGARYRLSPDLLADAIIETACITSSGTSNGYSERVFAVAIPEHKEHVLLNIGRLDWRRNEGDTADSTLLDGLWSTLKWEADYQRAQVKAAVQAAYFQPRQALAFARRLVDEGHGTDGDVCRIIGNAAYNMRYLANVCALLWEAGQDDARQTHQHPIRLLTELATPDPRKPIEYIEIVVDFALSLLPYPESWRGIYTPFDILEGALATEGHFTARETSRSISLSPYGVKPNDAVKGMRARIIEAMLASLIGENKRRAFLAAKLLAKAIHGPHGLLNREPSQEERSEWEKEFAQTLGLVDDLVDETRLPATVLVRIAESVAWNVYYPKGITVVPARRILTQLERDLATRTTRALIDGWGSSTWKIGADGQLGEFKTALAQLARDIDAAFPEAKSLAGFLDERLNEMKDYAGDGYGAPHILVGTLVGDRLGLAREVLDMRLHNESGPLAGYGAIALATLLRHAPQEAYARIGTLHEQAEELELIAQAYAISIESRKPTDTDRRLLRRIFATSNPSVLRHASWIIRGVVTHDRLLAIDLLANADPALAQATGQQYFYWLDDEKLIPFEVIRDDQLERIVNSLRPLDRLDDDAVRSFLGRVVKRAPQFVINLAKIRLEDSLAADDWGKHPLGGISDERKPFRLMSHPNAPALLRDLLNWGRERIGDHGFNFRFADLVHGLCAPYDAACVAVFEAWSEGGTAEHFNVLTVVLREAGPSFIFDHEAFIGRALRAARSLGRKVHRDLSSAIFATTLSGGRSGVPGKPFESDLKLKQRAEQQLARLSSSDPAYELYNNMRGQAEQDIGRQIAYGRLMDEEDADA